jgi:hypothetical protein
MLVPIYFVVAFATSLALTPARHALAYRYGLIAKQQQDRRRKRPGALFGGVASAALTRRVALTLRFTPTVTV